MFIAVTSQLLIDSKVFLNIYDISAIYVLPKSNHTTICMTDTNKNFEVTETPEQILALIEGVQA